MLKRLLGPLVLSAVALLSGCDSSPGKNAVEDVWRRELVAPHKAELVELLGAAGRGLVVHRDLAITGIAPLGDGVYGVSFSFMQELTRSLSELSGIPAGSMRIMRTVFPAGEQGETSVASSYVKLKRTQTGWTLAGAQ